MKLKAQTQILEDATTHYKIKYQEIDQQLITEIWELFPIEIQQFLKEPWEKNSKKEEEKSRKSWTRETKQPQKEKEKEKEKTRTKGK